MKEQNIYNLGGWIIFLISLVVYVATVEPTVSLWDCGEFITSAWKLEINHSPGAPLFMLIGRIFSLFSFGDPTRAALMINLVSVISSAATIMFLFWTIVWLISKLEQIQLRSYPLALKSGAAAIGALSFAFTDSFWFSAVEAEVYALSSLFSAVILWIATRWERESKDKWSTRWIILIFYLIGLSIGVHLLNLLVIPSVALIIYFKNYKYSLKGLILTILISGIGIIALLNFFIPGLFDLSGNLELTFVNQFHLPIHSGLITYFVFIILVILLGLYYSNRKQLPGLNLAILCFTFMLIGYTSYVITMIRASAKVPINQGDPSTTFSLLDYLNREQYGTRPILYGPVLGSAVTGFKERDTWIAKNGRYLKNQLNSKIEYDAQTMVFFPRIHSNDPEHMEAYKQWVDFRGRHVYGTSDTIVPTFSENLLFFLKYQFGYMYMRYFLWNFAGRQNDIQGNGDLINGNWQCGIPFIDRYFSGPQESLPTLMRENKGRNSYYFLPLIIGLAGLLFHYHKDRKGFLITALLFFLMGAALVVYLNEVPNTPRERDYVYVGSFYAFCIWIGIGIIAVYVQLTQLFREKIALSLTLAIGFTISPALLFAQNYDDHDRSGRYAARDLARNYLESCEPNAILFTHGDNDTFPLWYCQEVEGIRRDVRVVVMPYLSAGWYISQLQHKIYENEAPEMTIPAEKYQTDEIDYVYIVPKIKNEQSFLKVLDFLASNSPETKLTVEDREPVSYIPVNKLRIEFPGKDTIHVELKTKGIYKNDLAFWDIIVSNKYHRPICFTAWVDAAEHGLSDNLIFDGLVYRLTDQKCEGDPLFGKGQIESESLYQILMKKCNWDNLKDKSVNFDWYHRRMMGSMQIRNAFYRLAKNLSEEEKSGKAVEVLKKSEETISLKLMPVDYQCLLMATLYADNGQKKLSAIRFKELGNSLEEQLRYYISFSSEEKETIIHEINYHFSLYTEMIKLATGILSIPEIENMKKKLAGYAGKLE